MGVPKFYRYMSERYPCLSEVVKEYQIPEFDNLYLDMNGVIHTCSHPNDDDPHFRITEEKIFADIFHYLEVLFRMIQPRKVFFMAVDGVAPRAKMNQQRGRRFRSAREAELNEKKARDRGEDLPTEDRFDSNCITPGTPFMVRLQEQLKYFVANKISTDSLWRNTKVILSGHETPGEGEHKIMDFIRYEKAQPGYDPNTRHCLYGLDADLVMLGLCTHDPHFSLLREEVKFGGKKSQASKRTPTPEETTFHLLHLSLLREYLDFEFQEMKSLPFYNLENIIDDWVLMGFLVGNDFIPHLPNMHINKGALPELYNCYKTVLPTLGGYINEGGSLNLPRFEKFLAQLSESELEKFDDIYSDAKWLEGKTARKNNGKTEVEPTPGPSNVFEMLEGIPEPGVNPIQPSARNADLQRLMDSAMEFDSSESNSEVDPLDCEDRSGFYQMEFRQHKRDYYMHKLGYAQVNEETLREQAEGYVRAIQWNLHYYYNGCMSWSWYYPHHFSPWITDIKGFSNMTLEFEMSKPFLPFEQLLAVLPAASRNLVPPALQWLMTSNESEIIDYYPPDFEQDLNGKQQDWEAVVLIPFINEKRLLDAMGPLYPKLTVEEAERNVHGPMYVCSYSLDCLGKYPAPAYFPAIEQSHCTMTKVDRNDWNVPLHLLKKGLMEGAKLGVFFPGFPTLQHIRHTARLSKAQVKVFEQTSRGENMILTLENQGRPELVEVAKAMIGKEVWVGWPHLFEAKVTGVSNSQFLYSDPDKREDSLREFKIIQSDIRSRYSSRYGIEIGSTDILIHACPMSGRRYEMASTGGRITLEKQWHKTSQFYPLQTVVADIPVHDASLKQYCTVEELFKPDTVCFMLGEPCYGGMGTVVGIDPAHQGRIRLKFVLQEEPDLRPVFAKQNELQENYVTGYKAAQYIGITSHILSRITGTIFLVRGAREQQTDSVSKTNIGLNLKFNKKSEEVSGFTKKSESGWTYSMACIEVLKIYQSKFPEVFEYIASSNNSSNDMFHEMDVFDEETAEERVKELITWLEGLPTLKAPRQPFGTETLDSEVVKTIESLTSTPRAVKEWTLQVRPKLLYMPNQYAGSSLVDPHTTFNLFDRVVNIREGFSVPLGLRGSIIRIQKGEKPADSLYDVVFDQPFTGGLTLNCSPDRGYRLPGFALINISFKEKTQWVKEDRRRNKPRAVVQPYEGGYSQQAARNNGGSKNSWNDGPPKDGPSRGVSGGQGYNNQGRGYSGPNPKHVERQSSKEPEVKEKKANPLLDPEPVLVQPPDPSTIPLPKGFIQNSAPAGRGRGGVSIMQREGGKGRGRGQSKHHKPQAEPQFQQEQHMQNLWQSLQQGNLPIAAVGGLSKDILHGQGGGQVPEVKDGRSMQEMELSIKKMLNISASGRNPLLDSSTASSQSGTKSSDQLRDLLLSIGLNTEPPPRYTAVQDQTTCLLQGEVTLEDGRIFTSKEYFGDIEEAYESAACSAVAALQNEKSRKSTKSSKSQPGSYPTGQPGSYDGGRNSGQQGFYQASKSDRSQFVPLQVAKRAVQSRERDEISQTRSSPSPTLQLKEEPVNLGRTTKEGLVAQGVNVENPKPSSEKKGRGRGQRPKVRLAANFGGQSVLE